MSPSQLVQIYPATCLCQKHPPSSLTPHANRQHMSPNLTLFTTSTLVQATHCHLSPGLNGTSLLTGLPAPTLAPHHPFSTQRAPVQTWVRRHRFSTLNPPVASHLPPSKTKVLPLPSPQNPSSLSSTHSRLPASPQAHACSCRKDLALSVPSVRSLPTTLPEGFSLPSFKSLLKCHLLRLSLRFNPHSTYTLSPAHLYFFPNHS